MKKGTHMKGMVFKGNDKPITNMNKHLASMKAGSSPFQQAPEKKKKGFPSETTKPRDLEKEEAVGSIGDQINNLGEDLFQDRITKKQHDAKVKILRAKEKAAITANKLR